MQVLYLVFLSQLSRLYWVRPGQYPLITWQRWHPGRQGCSSKNETRATKTGPNDDLQVYAIHLFLYLV